MHRDSRRSQQHSILSASDRDRWACLRRSPGRLTDPLTTAATRLFPQHQCYYVPNQNPLWMPFLHCNFSINTTPGVLHPCTRSLSCLPIFYTNTPSVISPLCLSSFLCPLMSSCSIPLLPKFCLCYWVDKGLGENTWALISDWPRSNFYIIQHDDGKTEVFWNKSIKIFYLLPYSHLFLLPSLPHRNPHREEYSVTITYVLP